MRQPTVDDRVRLVQEIPTLSLPRGAVGIVRSTWFAPSVAYEVEFHQIGNDYQVGCRCLLRPEQVELDGDDASAAATTYDEATCHVGVM